MFEELLLKYGRFVLAALGFAIAAFTYRLERLTRKSQARVDVYECMNLAKIYAFWVGDPIPPPKWEKGVLIKVTNVGHVPLVVDGFALLTFPRWPLSLLPWGRRRYLKPSLLKKPDDDQRLDPGAYLQILLEDETVEEALKLEAAPLSRTRLVVTDTYHREFWSDWLHRVPRPRVPEEPDE